MNREMKRMEMVVALKQRGYECGEHQDRATVLQMYDLVYGVKEDISRRLGDGVEECYGDYIPERHLECRGPDGNWCAILEECKQLTELQHSAQGLPPTAPPKPAPPDVSDPDPAKPKAPSKGRSSRKKDSYGFEEGSQTSILVTAMMEVIDRPFNEIVELVAEKLGTDSSKVRRRWSSAKYALGKRGYTFGMKDGMLSVTPPE